MGKKFNANWVIRDASITIKNGEAVGLLGANGAGKSTWLKCMLGLIYPNEGYVNFDRPPNYLPEQPVLPLAVSPIALLKLRCQATQTNTAQIEASLKLVGLDQTCWHTPVQKLSKGMRQRLSIAWVLSDIEAGNIILDEPMSGLDALGRIRILECFLKRKQQGAAILMCSHIVTDMVRLCDRVLILAKGEIREEVILTKHSMDEAHLLENKLRKWSEA